MEDTAELSWRKSSFSSNGGECVEVGTTTAGNPIVYVRDTKSRERGHLTVDAATWHTFTNEIKSGKLDIPALPRYGPRVQGTPSTEGAPSARMILPRPRNQARSYSELRESHPKRNRLFLIIL